MMLTQSCRDMTVEDELILSSGSIDVVVVEGDIATGNEGKDKKEDEKEINVDSRCVVS